MGSLYYDWAQILRDAGCKVGVNSINQGWERRARSSGGFSAVPLGIWWHHTASSTSVDNDLSWQCHGCPDKPVGNMLLARDGTFWPVAGGASNCAGKGGPWTFSRGSVAKDSGNTGGVQIECANGGTGEPYPVAQIDAYFMGSNAINAALGNRPDDIVSHRRWAPDRKIDPARNDVVAGAWVPRSETSSGTWNLDDMKAECVRRAGAGPGPQPPEDDDMTDDQARMLSELWTALVQTQPGFPDPSGGTGNLNAAWAALWGEQLVANNVMGALNDLKAGAAPQPGFTDPFGNGPLAPSWAALWGYNYIKENVLPQLAQLQADVNELKARP